MTERFADKTAAVTGAGSGIGRATAVRLLREGAQVIAIDRAHTLPWSDDVAPMVTLVSADIADSATSVLLEAAVSDTGGVLDILVNAAGVLRIAPFLEVTAEDWNEVIAVNLAGTFFLSQTAARIMIAAAVPGRIVNVSSVHAVVSEPNAAPYTATKGGIEAMTRTIASELAPYGITANCVRPGATRTGMSAPLYEPDIVAALEERIPLREIAEPDWIAAAICYLASDEARYTTGTSLDVDGGYAMNGALPGTIYRR
jgi:NAD(P)-dependent dehydrogenase (short-subunit alcohol dehydrogenase family)